MSRAALAVERPTVARMTVKATPRPRGRPFTGHTTGLRERAWWLMRELPRFTLDDLLFTLAGPEDRDAAGNLQKYIRALERTGVLVRLQRRAPGTALTSNGHVIWRLARDLGRQAPVWQSVRKVLYDPNSIDLLPVVQAVRPRQAKAVEAA